MTKVYIVLLTTRDGFEIDSVHDLRSGAEDRAKLYLDRRPVMIQEKRVFRKLLSEVPPTVEDGASA